MPCKVEVTVVVCVVDALDVLVDVTDDVCVVGFEVAVEVAVDEIDVVAVVDKLVWSQLR